ncbi:MULTISPECIES: tyrosine-type recombinase/integrase [Streptomyces]|uniref:Site-specific integrase n=1 Tax=Streptomyces evansiae TaxID=3075535 RepID=A0ABU2QVV7_9ACTN|nr:MULTISPECIES: site-specific integrase [unclassified Streptomyces]MDT0408578.1 site-specific integrase [Streptomyces sp. DSM 41979]MYQ58686.1 tyrosine-type recombinase/integrase [Streptomyces sp. SID4926]SCE29009.1 Site-specific recombinase XerD [Streptomyces sp. DfronAA-171]
MADRTSLPVGVRISTDIEHRPNRPAAYRARVRWHDPVSKRRLSLSEGKDTEDEAKKWLQALAEAAEAGLSPSVATVKLADYGATNMDLALRGLELKTRDPYLAGWRTRVTPTMGHLAVRTLTNGVIDRAVQGWIADGHSRSTMKNTIAVLVRVMEQAVRDNIIKVNPARVTGWQKLYKQAEDELLDPRALALPDWETLVALADALVAASYGHYQGWGEVVLFAACTAARIGEVAGCRIGDIDTTQWIWTIRRQTTPAPGGLTDKGTKGKRARFVPIVEEIRPLVAQRILTAGPNPDARLFTGPRGGRISTAVLRDATHWDEVVTKLGYEHLRRHDLRHTGLTWFADAGTPVHILRRIAGHGSLNTTQRYLHPDIHKITAAGTALSAHLTAIRAPHPLPHPIAMTR